MGSKVNAYMIMSAVKELNISGLSENVVNIDNNPLDYKEKFLVSNKIMFQLYSAISFQTADCLRIMESTRRLYLVMY